MATVCDVVDDSPLPRCHLDPYPFGGLNAPPAVVIERRDETDKSKVNRICLKHQSARSTKCWRPLALSRPFVGLDESRTDVQAVRGREGQCLRDVDARAPAGRRGPQRRVDPRGTQIGLFEA